MRKLAFFLSIITLISCNKNEQTQQDFSIEKNSLSLLVQKEESVKIVSGSKEYTLSVSDPTIVTASIEQELIKIVGQKQGQTQVVVTDTKSNQSQTIKVTVFDKLSLETSALSLNPDRKVVVNITTGSEQYQVKSDNESVATAELKNGKEIHITTIANGQAKIIVTDSQTNDIQEITLIVQSDIIINQEGVLTKYTAQIPDDGKLILTNIKAIDKEVFKNNQNIIHLVLEGVETIGENAFASCQAIETISISGVKTIEKLAFSFNAELKSVTITNPVNTDLVINTQAFANCPNLESVVLPSETKELKSNVFSFCRSLQTITSNSIEAPKIARNTFPSSLKTQGKLIVPKGSKDKYTTWESSFSTIQEQ